ncbi:MAG TPA: hypothetical protein VKG43_09475 [Acidimicrobiales bacterium]|nr:hypothetical protein [Acidimicrobiales bacterium]
MNGSLVPLVLPRARAVTAALSAPAPPPLEPDEHHEVRRLLEDRLGSLAAGTDEEIRVDAHEMAVVLGGDRPYDRTEPFRWSPTTARRSIGIAAVRSVVRGVHRTPAAATAAAIAEAVGDAEAGRARRNSPDAWLAGAPGGVRALVQAEAVTWATQLLTALEWSALDPGPEIGRDERWRSSGSPRVCVVGRAEVRALADRPAPAGPRWAARRTPHPDGVPRRPALFSVLGGSPGPASRHQLAVVALVEVLAHPGRPTPARVLGWWPAPGRAVLVPVDRAGLEEAAEAVVEVVAARASGASATA